MCTVSSILSDRIGIRETAVTGAVLATAGLVATAFIERLELLYLTFGILLGIGSSMVYSPSLVILGHYFKKHMGLVNGIVAFGSSLFTMALTRILPYLLSTIGIKYCFLFLAGLQCLLIVFALSWKPVFKKEDHLESLTLSTESVYRHCNDCCSWTKKFLSVKIWKQKAYVIWVLSLGIALFGYFVPFFHLVSLLSHIIKPYINLNKWIYHYWIQSKTLWQKEKLLITCNFSFCNIVFLSHLLQRLQNASVRKKQLRLICFKNISEKNVEIRKIVADLKSNTLLKN